MIDFGDKDYILHCGDCLEIMKTFPDNSIDVVITSPPYNTLPKKNNPSGLHAKRKNGVNEWIKKASEGYFDQMEESEYQKFLLSVEKEMQRVCDGLYWINHKTRYRNCIGIHPMRIFKGNLYSEIVWDRGSSMVLNAKKYAPSHEYFFGFGRPNYWDDINNTLLSVWRIPVKPMGINHPCPFPLKIISRIIESSCKSNGVILDPFMGSGTTGVAAMRLGRKFIGIEIEPKYFDIARKRIEAETNTLFQFEEKSDLSDCSKDDYLFEVGK